MSMRPTSNRTAAPARSEFKGKPGAVKKADRLDAKSDRAIASKTGTKLRGR